MPGGLAEMTYAVSMLNFPVFIQLVIIHVSHTLKSVFFIVGLVRIRKLVKQLSA